MFIPKDQTTWRPLFSKKQCLEKKHWSYIPDNTVYTTEHDNSTLYHHHINCTKSAYLYRQTYIHL
jgi:hypothetical protein